MLSSPEKEIIFIHFPIAYCFVWNAGLSVPIITQFLKKDKNILNENASEYVILKTDYCYWLLLHKPEYVTSMINISQV